MACSVITETFESGQEFLNPQVATTEMDILRPIFDCEVLVIDKLGPAKPTERVCDTIAHVLNYLKKRTTIVTTNYPDRAPGTSLSTREETLGDRIGERMRSRLNEMCQTIEIFGEDFRRMAGRGSFTSWKGEFKQPQ